MKNTELFSTDYLISHDITINLIKSIFDKDIKHCYDDVDMNIAEYLEIYNK